MTRDPFDLVGHAIDARYDVESVVGEGGFAVVYRGIQRGLGAPVAIKCLKVPTHFTAEGRGSFLEQFQTEGKVLVRLAEHPSIVRVIDYNITSVGNVPIPYLVLEWLNGRDLETALREPLGKGQFLPPERGAVAPAARRNVSNDKVLGPSSTRGPGNGAQDPRSEGGASDAKGFCFRESEAIALLKPAIDAVAFAHREGIAHCDLKPANLFVTDSRLGKRIKVLDFGIARAMHEGERVTQQTSRLATVLQAFSPSYGTPEQFWPTKFGQPGAWTDVYAFGLLLVELVSGRRALAGSSFADYLHASTSPIRPSPRAKGAIVSDWFEGLCTKALAVAPMSAISQCGGAAGGYRETRGGIRDRTFGRTTGNDSASRFHTHNGCPATALGRSTVSRQRLFAPSRGAIRAPTSAHAATAPADSAERSARQYQ